MFPFEALISNETCRIPKKMKPPSLDSFIFIKKPFPKRMVLLLRSFPYFP